MKAKHLIPALLFTLFFSSATNAKGINCERASSVVEKTVCSSAELLKLDEALADTYSDILFRLHQPYDDTLKTSQINWIKEVRKKCGASNLGEKFRFGCIKDAYTDRRSDLKNGTEDHVYCAFHPINNIGILNKKLYCENEDIKKTKREMDDAFLNLRWALPRNLSEIFSNAQSMWSGTAIDEKCELPTHKPDFKDRPFSSEEESTIANCFVSEMESRTKLFTEEIQLAGADEPSQTVPYRLSKLEIFVIRQLSVAKNDFFGLLESGVSDMPLKRLVSSIILEPKDKKKILEDAINANPDGIALYDNRYFGEIGDVPREFSKAGVIVDLETGDVAFFAADDGSPWVFYEKACANEDFKTFLRAGRELRTGTQENFSIYEIKATDVRETPCQ